MLIFIMGIWVFLFAEECFSMVKKVNKHIYPKMAYRSVNDYMNHKKTKK